MILLPRVFTKFKKIINDNKVDIVHSHLFWSTMLTRLATPKNIPVITTIHAFIASSLEYKFLHIRVLDKFTYGLRKNIIIGVAKGAEKEYFSFLKLKPYRSYTLHTFVDTKKFDPNKIASTKTTNNIFKLISVGNLRKQKNQKFLLEAFVQLDNNYFQLDIYGEGMLREELELFIKNNNINVNLKGAVNNLPAIINQYDLFVMSSTYEGFSLGVLEAMAMKVPLLLSNIASFKEQCGDTALYFDGHNIYDFITKLKKLATDKARLKNMAELGQQRVLQNFTLEHHMAGLRNIYCETLNRYERN